jgi:hypothetical protein
MCAYDPKLFWIFALNQIQNSFATWIISAPCGGAGKKQAHNEFVWPVRGPSFGGQGLDAGRILHRSNAVTQKNAPAENDERRYKGSKDQNSYLLRCRSDTIYAAAYSFP